MQYFVVGVPILIGNNFILRCKYLISMAMQIKLIVFHLQINHKFSFINILNRYFKTVVLDYTDDTEIKKQIPSNGYRLTISIILLLKICHLFMPIFM